MLIAKRKQSKILASMAALPDITTEVAQDPVCFDPLDPEDVSAYSFVFFVGYLCL